MKRGSLYIDVTEIAKNDSKTGIQRVVREIVRNIYRIENPALEPRAVRFQNGTMIPATDWLRSLGVDVPGEKGTVSFTADDLLFMLDLTWIPYSQFFPLFAQARAAGTAIFTAVYDILPLLLHGHWDDKFSRIFEERFKAAVVESDEMVCISKATADAASAWIDRHMPGVKKPSFSYWHLGADFPISEAPSDPAATLPCSLTESQYLLMVSTIEPRKNYDLALEAMDLLWSRGFSAKLCVVGKPGWKVDELVRRMRRESESGSRMVLIENADDRLLAQLYRRAHGFLFVSKGEGFGLPLIEAAQYGVPVACSDLPVFREIAGDHASYLRIDTPEHLADDIEAWWGAVRMGAAPDSSLMPRLTWEESARQLMDVLLRRHAERTAACDGKGK